MVRILYFAALAGQVGATAEEAALPEGVATVGALLAWLRARGRPWTDALAEGRVQATVNRGFADPGTPLADGDEVALLPARR